MRRQLARLAVRVYLVGLCQTAVIAAGFLLSLWITRPEGPGPSSRHAAYVLDSLVRVAADPVVLQREIDRVQTLSGATVWVIDAGGAVVAGAQDTPRTCAEQDEDSRRRPCLASDVTLADGRAVTIEVKAPGGGPPRATRLALQILALVLLVVGVSSWLLARSVSRPLRRLTDVARAFGGGDLRARAGLSRADELGEVAAAFDDMADRVAALLRGERELLANVSHELRTPLARIRVALDLAAEGDALLRQETLADIAIDLAELERLIADVLTAARLTLEEGPGSSGLPPLRTSPIEASDLLDQSATRFRDAHPKRPLVVLLGAGLPALEVDTVLVRRALDNLLDNADKYSPRLEDPIELRADALDGSLVILVVDTGMGIPAEALPLLFRPFYRVDPSRTRSTGGLGLGLALARRILEAHGGSVTLESTHGVGTRVRVTLPSRARTAKSA